MASFFLVNGGTGRAWWDGEFVLYIFMLENMNAFYILKNIPKLLQYKISTHLYQELSLYHARHLGGKEWNYIFYLYQ